MLTGKTILITGSSKGIGAATARLAKKYGANVILHGRTESPELNAIATELNSEKIVCDIGDREAIFREVNKLLEKNIQIHGVANVAAEVKNRGPFIETTEEDWLESYKTNVFGIISMCQAVLPSMQKNKYGRIVNIGSVRAYPQGTVITRLPYSSAKAAVLNITAGLAKEYAQYGININSISPGGVNTDTAKAWDEATRKRNANVPLERIGEPDEIAEAICFFLSDKASYAVGQDFVFDGGYLIGK
ncbi:SDR family oxidoreductase [Patescibacteria group bacterium]|nr:SDR family oxidoreductase [Patescibacteria group bacterium]